MRSAPCASAPSHPLHAMPPRFTRNSDRPRASDRTMVDTEDTRTRLPSFQTRLASSPSADEPHRDGQQVRAQTSRANREALLQTSGLDLEKTLSSPVEAELFFLTSLFIELIDPVVKLLIPNDLAAVVTEIVIKSLAAFGYRKAHSTDPPLCSAKVSPRLILLAIRVVAAHEVRVNGCDGDSSSVTIRGSGSVFVLGKKRSHPSGQIRRTTGGTCSRHC